MNKNDSLEISDEYPEVTQADLDRAIFRIGLKPSKPQNQQITILLDTVLIEYFKAKAGEADDYKRLINDTLRWAIVHRNL